MMKRQPTNREYVLGGLFALLAMFPMVTSTAFDVPLEGRVMHDSLERAFKDRASEPVMRRMRWSIMRDCAQREAKGEENVCPDINDDAALERYWLPTEHEAAPPEEIVKATVDQLGNYEKHILRRAVRVGQCPPTLDGILRGFQALCEDEVSKGTERRDILKEAADAWVGAPRVGR